MPTADFTDWADYTETQISESEQSDRVGVILGGHVKTGQSWTSENRPVARGTTGSVY
jgi:hypothetical protein